MSRPMIPSNGSQGVWKVELLPSPGPRPTVRLLDATKDASEDVALDDFLHRCIEYFEDGCVIDRPFQVRLREGVVCCYMVGDRCAGLGHHKVKALVERRLRVPKLDRGSTRPSPNRVSNACAD